MHDSNISMEERELPEFNAMQRVKRRFFAMRNGDLAAQMVSHGARYKINFGLNLPQISEIARDFLPGGREYEEITAGAEHGAGHAFDSADFARRLRDNVTTRESMLIAPMLFPVEMLAFEEALEWAKSVPTPEIADVLCLKLLRRSDEAAAVVKRLMESDVDLHRYTALRLALNLLQTGKLSVEDAEGLIKGEEARACAITSSVCHQLKEEVLYL